MHLWTVRPVLAIRSRSLIDRWRLRAVDKFALRSPPSSDSKRSSAWAGAKQTTSTGGAAVYDECVLDLFESLKQTCMILGKSGPWSVESVHFRRQQARGRKAAQRVDPPIRTRSLSRRAERTESTLHSSAPRIRDRARPSAPMRNRRAPSVTRSAGLRTFATRMPSPNAPSVTDQPSLSHGLSVAAGLLDCLLPALVAACAARRDRTVRV